MKPELDCHRLPMARLNRRRFLTAGIAATTLSANLSANPPLRTVTSLLIASKLNQLIVGSHSQIDFVSLDTLQIIQTISTSMPNVHAIAMAESRNILLVAGGYPDESGEIEAYELQSGRLAGARSLGQDCLYAIESIRAASDGDLGWIAAGADGNCYWSDDLHHSMISSMASHSRAVLGICELSDGETVVSAGRDQTVRVWNRATQTEIHRLHNHTADVTTVTQRPNASGLPMVATTSIDRSVRFWQPTIGRMIRFARMSSPVLCGVWNDSGTRLAVGCQDGTIATINPDNVEVTHVGNVEGGWVNAIAILGDDSYAAERGGQIHRFDV